MELEDKKRTPKLLLVLSVCMCIFQLYTAAVMPLQAMPQRAMHLAFIFPITLIYEFLKEKRRPLRIAYCMMALVSAACCLYVVVTWQELQNRTTRLTPLDYAAAIALILIVLYVTYKSIGIWMPLIGIVCIAYVFLGPYLPGVFHSAQVSFRRLISCLFCGS